jgi:hypothetical protein
MTMNDQQKETLRDCFEGCMPFEYALGAADIDGNNIGACSKALATWQRWNREMDEEGYYTF